MAPSFTNLPAEIIVQIIGNLNKSGWKLDLALSSHALYRITLPLLYSNIRLTSRTHLPCLVDKLLTAQDLAGYVIAVTVTVPQYPSSGLPEDNPVKTTPEFLKTAFNYIHSSTSLSSDQKESWQQYLADNREDVYLALLLASLRNLQHLDLAVAEELRDCVMDLFRAICRAERLFQNQSMFSRLQTVVSDCEEYEYGPFLDTLCLYLQIPSLRRISLLGVGSHNSDVDEAISKLQPGSSQLEHLELRHGRINPCGLANILSICTHLKTFIYEEGWSHIMTCAYSTPLLYKALRSCESTLENLWLDYEEDTEFVDTDDLTPMKDLTSLVALRHLRVGMFLIFEVDEGADATTRPDPDIAATREPPNLAEILPASIETLYIGYPIRPMALLTEGADQFTAALEHLLSQKEASVPNLRRITFETSDLDETYLDVLAADVHVEIIRVDFSLSIDQRRTLGFYVVSTPLMISCPSFMHYELGESR